MQAIHFSKMHGLGNDFVVIDAINQNINLNADQVRHIADRHFGIGCDQLLLVERPTRKDTDFHYRIFNADGSEVEQCGNGARCFARFVRDKGLTDKTEIAVETACGVIYPRIEEDGLITVNMGIPDFNPEALPLKAEQHQENYVLEIGGYELTIGAVSMGNPHAVYKVGGIDDGSVEQLGHAISTHVRFPQGVNAGFMQVVDRGRIKLRVHERGAGETLACGTGACAAVVVGHHWNELDDSVDVELPGGTLSIRWQGDGEPVWMTGPATHVFEGMIEL